MPSRADADTVAVIGLGRFGEAVARKLAAAGREVMVIDPDPDLIGVIAPVVTLAAEADGTSTQVLRDLSVDECRCAVVAIGEDLEASILATAALADLGIPEIWARATTEAHGRILERVGAHWVVYPEQEMGTRVGQLIFTGIEEYVSFPNGYALAIMDPPAWSVGQTVEQVGVKGKHGVAVIGLQAAGGVVEFPHPEHRIRKNERLAVAGPTEAVDAFPLAKS